MRMSRRAYPGWVVGLGVLCLVYLAGVGAVVLAPDGDPVATWWPAAGIAVSLLALAPVRWWPVLAGGVLVSSALANASGGRTLELSAVFGLANATEAVVAALVLRHGGRRRLRLESQEDLVRLAVAATAGGVTIATVAAAVVSRLEGGAFLETWCSVVASHGASTLVLVPVALALVTPTGGRRLGLRRRGELVVQVLALAAVTVAVFAPHQQLPLTFAPLPLLAWAALRFDVRTVSFEVAVTAVAATSLTAQGYGPFGHSLTHHDVDAVAAGALTQGYLVCTALMAMPLALATEQRARLLTRVSESERLFRRNFTESLVGMLLLRCRGLRLEIAEVNETAARLIGEDPGALVGRSLHRVLDTDERLDLLTARMLGGYLDGWDAETGLLGRPGARVRVSLTQISTDPGPVFSAQLLDVSAEHEALRRLEQAEMLTSATLDTTACIILVTDLAGTVVRVNSATTQLTGWTETELLGRPVWETPVAPTGAADTEALFTWPNRSGVPVVRETDARAKDGSLLRVVWNSNIVRDEHNRPIYAVMTGIDVTAERTTAGLNAHLMQAAITTALIGLDTAGRITVFNSGAENLLGWSAEEVVGTPFVRLLDPDELREWSRGAEDEQAAFDALTRSIDADGESAPRDWTWVRRGGQRHTVSMTLSVVADTFASQVGYLCVGRDVTEQRHSQEVLVAALDKERTAVERLRQLDEAKNEFVSTVSHELRTPVTSIVGYTEMLQDGSVVDALPEQGPLLETIARNGQRLIVICNDLLLLSGLDSGAAQWDREPVELTGVLALVEESVQPLLAGRDLDVRFVHEDGPVVVLGDRAQLERVLLNLMSNAIKFTEDGGEVEASLGAHDGEAWLSISDSGIGIPEEEQAGLFEKFFRSSTAQERAIPGTGLGLSIVAAIVAAHGGRIGVESAHLKGTTFTVRLPLKRPARV